MIGFNWLILITWIVVWMYVCTNLFIVEYNTQLRYNKLQNTNSVQLVLKYKNIHKYIHKIIVIKDNIPEKHKQEKYVIKIEEKAQM